MRGQSRKIKNKNKVRVEKVGFDFPFTQNQLSPSPASCVVVEIGTLGNLGTVSRVEGGKKERINMPLVHTSKKAFQRSSPSYIRPHSIVFRLVLWGSESCVGSPPAVSSETLTTSRCIPSHSPCLAIIIGFRILRFV